MATYTQLYIWLSLLGTESFIREVFHPEEAKVYMRAPFETKLPTAQISPPSILCEAGGGLHQAESCLWRWPDNLINSVYFVGIVADAELSFSSPSSIFHPVSSFNRLFFSPGLRMASRGRWLQSPGHRTRRFPWPEVWPSWAFFPLVLPHLDILR